MKAWHRVAVLVVLALVATALVGHEVVRDARGKSALLTRTGDVGKRVEWDGSKWDPISVSVVDVTKIPRDEWEGTIELEPKTQLVEASTRFTGNEQWVADAYCEMRLLDRAQRAWDEGVLVPYGADSSSSTNCSTDAEGEDVVAGRSYELRARFLIPEAVSLDELSLEITNSGSSWRLVLPGPG